jgi:hypothetical protein
LEKFRDLLRLKLDAQFITEKLKKDLRTSPELEFDPRKVYSLMLTVNREVLKSDQLDRTLRVEDIKRFFTLNSRLAD